MSGKTSLWRNPYVAGFLIGIAALTALQFSGLLEFTPDAPAPIAQVAPFELTAADGRPFGSAQLAGNPYVVGFFYVDGPRGPGTPIGAMGALQRRYEAEAVEGIHLVSVTVDPSRDTPERLAAFASVLQADPARWSLLTGPPEEVRRVVERGFRGAMGRLVVGDDGEVRVHHSAKLVLVDDKGRIRGYYGTDATGIDEVFHRSRHVRDQPF